MKEPCLAEGKEGGKEVDEKIRLPGRGMQEYPM